MDQKFGHPKPIIVIDGSNVAFQQKSESGKPKIANILAMNEALKALGYEPLVIVDAALWHEVDDPHRLDELIDKGKIEQAPAGTEADYFILRYAEDYKARIVSNDKYEPYQGDFPWIRDRRIPFMLIDGNVEFYKLEPAS